MTAADASAAPGPAGIGEAPALRLGPELTPIDDLSDRRVAQRGVGLLRAFNLADVLHAADVHVATRLGRAVIERDERVLLAVALAVRAVRQGSVCLDLTTVAEVTTGLDWPSALEWRAAIVASPLTAGPPGAAAVLHVDGDLVYLDRYWAEEGQVVDDLNARRTTAAPVLDEAQLEAALGAHFPPRQDDTDPDYGEQREAAEVACRQWTSIITGGPGTGKTTTIARFLGALMSTSDRPLRIALAAPTGKAAARMTQALRFASERADFPATHRAALQEISATTMHRMLGWRHGSSTRFQYDRGNRLPHDLVVIDETSMVSLTLMARLLEAMRPDARLVLVGDADQLASVDAGAVLKDLVDGLGHDSELVVRLGSSRRFGSAIGALADAIRRGDVEATLAAFGADPAVSLVDEGGADELVRREAVALFETAETGDATAAVAALDRHRLLTAHRTGAHGVSHWNRRVERWLQERLGVDWLPSWYAGQPLLVTANDYGLDLFNGDSGVVVRRSGGESALVARMTDGAPGPGREVALGRLADVETAHALTVHRSQGSQYGAVTVVLPPADSPLLTREMLYTAVTRAQHRVVVIGAPEAVAAAVSRPAQRASGLANRLRRPRAAPRTLGSSTPPAADEQR